MAQSSEYPDLLWMAPKSWDNSNRSSVQLVVIHTTEGSAHSSSAEDGAAYDQRRTDGTSTHYFHDSNSTIQCVHTADQAHAARTQGNKRGIHHELCTKSGSANWNDSYHQAMLKLAARQAARDAKKWGIPIKKLSSSQVDAGNKGFCGHVEVTYAFPEDNGSHTDPGPNFPWSQFLAMVEEEGDDVSEQDVTNALNKFFAVTNNESTGNKPDSRIGHDAGVQRMPGGPFSENQLMTYQYLGEIGAQTVATDKAVAELRTEFAELKELLEAHFTGIVEGGAAAGGA